ncbi:MAG: gliding motility-associated ABC transporter substrate-binding protein GldG [Bacteroidia bacterium]|nr:gliding motility-associated ABC transporter substrate-binding protein GldG [Bacteroidia bacterium]
MKTKSVKAQTWSELVIVIGILVFINLIGSAYFLRMDLTSEKRYSLSKASKELAGKLDDVLFVKVYLEGEFPAGFKRLSRSTKEMLDEFAVYSNGYLQYEFIDPFDAGGTAKTNAIVEELSSKGLQPTSVQIKREDELSQKIIVPGAILFYKGREYPLNLLKGQFGANPEEVINSSIELLEYEIANVLRKATQKATTKIAFINDHGTLTRWDIADAKQELEQFYTVEDVPLSMVPPEALNQYAGIIIPKPTETFSEFDKFKIDQYVMNGGKVLWFVETQIADMDSLNKEPYFMTGSYDLNLDDLLFRYGIRINPNLVQDIQCEAIPILSTLKNGTPQQKLLPWLFYPVAAPMDNHPIVKNMDHVWFQFANSIDTTATKSIRKTVLLRSSPYARVLSAPVRVDLNIARINPDPTLFSKGSFPMAVLLEGTFQSVFQYRMGANVNDELPFKTKIDNNKMIVVSDGDIIRNQRKKTTGEIFPLGYNRYTNQQFGNKRFVVNCIDYLCDSSGLIDVRSKEITLRLLNKAKVKQQRVNWQLVNLGLPITLVLCFGLLNHFIRKRKYTR